MDNKSALVLGMAWRQTGDKPFPEPMMTEFANKCMHGNWCSGWGASHFIYGHPILMLPWHPIFRLPLHSLPWQPAQFRQASSYLWRDHVKSCNYITCRVTSFPRTLRYPLKAQHIWHQQTRFSPALFMRKFFKQHLSPRKPQRQITRNPLPGLPSTPVPYGHGHYLLNL